MSLIRQQSPSTNRCRPFNRSRLGRVSIRFKASWALANLFWHTFPVTPFSGPQPLTNAIDMENVETQNPFATPKSLANLQEDRVGRSNECLWIGIVTITATVLAYGLPYCFDAYSMGSVYATTFGMLLYLMAGLAGLAGICIGGIEAVAQLSSETVFRQKETVFIGIALSVIGVAVPIVQCTLLVFNALDNI